MKDATIGCPAAAGQRKNARVYPPPSKAARLHLAARSAAESYVSARNRGYQAATPRLELLPA